MTGTVVVGSIFAAARRNERTTMRWCIASFRVFREINDVRIPPPTHAPLTQSPTQTSTNQSGLIMLPPQWTRDIHVYSH